MTAGPHDDTFALSTLTLEQAAGELQRAIATLRQAADVEAIRALVRSGAPEIGGAQVRALIAARRLRRDYLGLDTSDPGWALLLELLAARLEGSRMTINRLGEAAGLAPTTALRWITALHGNGLIARRPNADDERIVQVDLTDEADDRLRAYLLAALRLSPWVL